MAAMRDRPYLNSNFLVDLGTGDANSATAGFAEVIFPTFTRGSANRHAARPKSTPRHGSGIAEPYESRHLILKRGLIGALDLYSWWSSAPRGKKPQRRTVRISLLAEDHSTVVMTWRFLKAYPVTLAYSPLRATDGSVVMETVELAFDSVEMF
jgi:phage tail-like protein